MGPPQNKPQEIISLRLIARRCKFEILFGRGTASDVWLFNAWLVIVVVKDPLAPIDIVCHSRKKCAVRCGSTQGDTNRSAALFLKHVGRDSLSPPPPA